MNGFEVREDCVIKSLKCKTRYVTRQYFHDKSKPIMKGHIIVFKPEHKITEIRLKEGAIRPF